MSRNQGKEFKNVNRIQGLAPKSGNKIQVQALKSGSRAVVCRENVSKESVRKENVHKENACKESVRKEGVCAICDICGGCTYQGMPYDKQLAKKQKMMEELLSAYGEVLPILGMETPRYYRNKVHHVFTRDRKGKVHHGFYEAGSHRVVEPKECMLEDQLSQAIIQTVAELLPSFKIKIFDEDTGYGFLRHVLVRRGFASGEVMVVLVCADVIFPSKNNFVKALRAKHPEITTVVLNVNDKRTSMVLGERNIPLYGPGFIKDQLCGLTFRISPDSFYQVNPVQTKVLYETAISYAQLTGKETVMDAYCGIGTIGLSAAAKAGHVIGVELNGNAVRDARNNAKENKISSASFYQGDAGAFMMQMAQEGQKADVVFMDPPRSGSTQEFMDAIGILAPNRVVYVSCGPESLARDLKYLVKKGYRVEKIQPVDMFPATGHVETVVLLSRIDK